MYVKNPLDELTKNWERSVSAGAVHFQIPRSRRAWSAQNDREKRTRFNTQGYENKNAREREREREREKSLDFENWTTLCVDLDILKFERKAQRKNAVYPRQNWFWNLLQCIG